MDKLKYMVQKTLKWFNNLSIQKSYIAYIITSLIIAGATGGLVIAIAGEMKNSIYIYDQYLMEYPETRTSIKKVEENQILRVNEEEDKIVYHIINKENQSRQSFSIPRDGNHKVVILRDKQQNIKGLRITTTEIIKVPIMDYILSIVMIMALPVLFFISCMICSILFFKYKLNPPLQLLMQASEKISDNELDFQVMYDNKDEMGQLCSSYELMREALYDNQKELWRNIEERKRLNSAFSHDLRTPLTVLKGYSEMMLMGLENEQINQEQLQQTIKTMSDNIERLEKYTQEMSRMQKLEDITVNKKNILVDTMIQQLKETGSILSSNAQFYFCNNVKINTIKVDLEIILQVYENLIANANRYAKSEISVNCYLLNQSLYIEISDDGIGFTKEGLVKATNPFYKEKENVNNSHFGLGLHICKLLTEKHGGGIKVKNNNLNGATISVDFGKVI